ncbi:MAG: outer membrane beta-barrel protein [Gammaproteobacteria bacterium]
MMDNKTLAKPFTLILALLVMTAISPTVYAAQSSFYGGINIGSGDVDFSGYEDSDTLSIYAGNNLSDQMAIEFGYTDLGEFEVTGFSSAHVEVDGLEVSVVGKMPTGNTLELFGRLGLYMWDAEGVLFGVPVGSDSGTSVTFGVGLDMHFSQNFGGRIAFQHYGDVADADITNVTLGIFTSF